MSSSNGGHLLFTVAHVVEVLLRHVDIGRHRRKQFVWVHYGHFLESFTAYKVKKTATLDLKVRKRYTCLHLLSFLFSYAQAVKWVEAVMVHKVFELVVFQIATRRHVHFETAEDY